KNDFSKKTTNILSYSVNKSILLYQLNSENFGITLSRITSAHLLSCFEIQGNMLASEIHRNNLKKR
ncbi:hypothetical protein, partial [Escherichia coli]|uniref:hypothetical protein n=1 Tax=Escherichia coli TaxID=562 RepID=UPI003B7934E2